MGKSLGLLGAAIVPPVAAFAFLQTWANAHPIRMFVVFAAYEVVVWGAGFVGKLVGGTADELRDRWKDPLAKSIDERTRRRLSRFEHHYRDSMLGSLRFIDLKGLATTGYYTPELDEVFVDVSLVHRAPSEVPSDVLSRGQIQPGRRFLGDLIDQPKPVVLAVLGAPGCGKTTLLRHTALLVCRQYRRRRRRVPLLLYLRDHLQAISTGTALPDLIDQSAPDGWFKQELLSGSCVVLIDGLDEVADEVNRREVSDWLERQVAHYPLNDFVITSRPQGYQSAPVPGATVVHVRGFTSQQVVRFVRGWYLAFERQRSTGEKATNAARRAAAEANDLLDRLHQNPSLYELTVNPLLLTMIANVHMSRGALPGSRVDLYREICQVLLWRRQEAKKLASELTGDQKMALLGELAYSMMSGRLRDIGVDQAKAEFRSLLRRKARTVDENDFLSELTSSGLMLERERNLLAFAHLTFQEYLAANHIREKQLTRVLIDNVDDVWWRETTLLHVARADADPIVQACLDSRTVRALSLAFDCSEQNSDLAPGLRAGLDRLQKAVSDPATDSPTRSLMTSVVVSRHLSKVVCTGEGTHLCAEPVPTRIYRLFLENDPRHLPDAPLGAPDEPVRGVWSTHTRAFVNWVNEGAATGQIFRLARAEELGSSPLASRLGSLRPWTSAGRSVTSHHDSESRLTQDDLYADLRHDFELLPELVVSAELIKKATTRSRGVLFLPPQPKLRVLRLGRFSATRPEATIGRAMSIAAHRCGGSTISKFAEQFSRAFTDVFRREEAISYMTHSSSMAGTIQALRSAPLTDWGEAIMRPFVDVATSVFSKNTPLTPELAAELRVAAMCLSRETDKDHEGYFWWIAVGTSITERRADGRIPTTETIVLATDS